MEMVDPSELPDFHERNFAQWATGDTWRARRGVDFQGSIEGFKAALRRWSIRNGHRLTTSRDGDALIFRLTPQR